MMDLNHADPQEFQRQAIDAKIKSFEESHDELIRVLRYRRNALAPISSLPIETIEGRFSFLRVPWPQSSKLGEKPENSDPLAWLRVAHVCHHWREIALKQPRFWSRVDFTNLSLPGAAEILSRTKTAPLYLETRIPHPRWNNPRVAALGDELQRHASHICHLGIRGPLPHLYRILERLVSPAPILEYLKLSCEQYWPKSLLLPDTLFNGTTPRLSRLEILNGDIYWTSPLLKGLKCLEIRSPSRESRPDLPAWLDSLEEMSQLKTLVLHSASPISASGASLPFDVERTIKLSSLTHLDISASLRDCALALAHLDLPALAMLRVTARSRGRDSDEVQGILPYVAIHSHGTQDIQPLQSALIHTNGTRLDMLAWTVPDINFYVRDPDTFLDTMLSARMMLSVTTKWFTTVTDFHRRIFNAAMAGLPLNNLVTLLTPDGTWFNEEVWRSHAPRWRLLQCVCLGPTAACAFRNTLNDNETTGDPILPLLRKLVLVDMELRGSWIRDLCDTLIKRVERGAPLDVLDLRTCVTTDHTAIQQLSQTGVITWGPTEGTRQTQRPSFAKYYCDARIGLLIQEDSDPDSDLGNEDYLTEDVYDEGGDFDEWGIDEDNEDDEDPDYWLWAANRCT